MIQSAHPDPDSNAAPAPPIDEHDRRLVQAVRPPDWVNPEPIDRYDLVVIGGGTAGLVTAAGGAGLGARVALIERHRLGGDCLNTGCVPSKALIRSARAAADLRAAPAFGIHPPGPLQIDFPAVMERLRRLRAGLSHHDSAERFRGLGVHVFLGAAHFADAGTVVVGAGRLRARRFVIATGSRPSIPDIPGLVEAGYLTSDTVFSLTARPDRLAVIGGGPIGTELAQAFQRLGSQVTLFHKHSHLLERDDPEAAAIVQRALERDGVRVVLQARIERVRTLAAGVEIVHAAADRTVTETADRILVAAGRRPNVEQLDLAAAGVAFDSRRGIVVDDLLRTRQRHIFAVGDVCLPWKFTHAADASARIVIQNALFAGRKRISRLTVPWCTYTDPEVAHVGHSERTAHEAGLAIRTFQRPLAAVDRAVLDGETDGFVKVHVRAGTDRIVGATVVARHAGEMIHELTLAMATGQGLGRLASIIHPYPTQADAIRQLGDAYQRSRLTPWVARLLATWLRWTL